MQCADFGRGKILANTPSLITCVVAKKLTIFPPSDHKSGHVHLHYPQQTQVVWKGTNKWRKGTRMLAQLTGLESTRKQREIKRKEYNDSVRTRGYKDHLSICVEAHKVKHHAYLVT